jgi:hypothetical protein
MLAKLRQAEHDAEKLAEKAEKLAEKTAKKATKNIDGVGFLGGWTKNGAVKAAPDKFSFGLGGEKKRSVHHAPKAGQTPIDLTKVHHNHTTKLHKIKTVDTTDLSHIIDPKSCRGQCYRAWDLFIHVMHGIRHGLAQFVTCGVCFDRYNEKVIVVEEPDEHKKSCRPDAQVFGLLNLLVLIVGGISYLVAESFQPLPTYFRVTHFSASECSSKHVKLMEYVPASVCMKLKKQSVDLKKRLIRLVDVRDVGKAQVQSGPPPLTAESQVITFTKHYRWGLSWFADQYTQETCVSAAELPEPIAQESGQPPLYPKTQVLDECLDPKIWETGEKSAKLSGSTCLGTSRLTDVVGYFDDRECKSLIKVSFFCFFLNRARANKHTQAHTSTHKHTQHTQTLTPTPSYLIPPL